MSQPSKYWNHRHEHLKVRSSLVSSLFVKFWNHHHLQFGGVFYQTKGSYPLAVNSHPPPGLMLGNCSPPPPSCLHGFTCCGHIKHQMHATCGPLNGSSSPFCIAHPGSALLSKPSLHCELTVELFVPSGCDLVPWDSLSVHSYEAPKLAGYSQTHWFV